MSNTVFFFSPTENIYRITGANEIPYVVTERDVDVGRRYWGTTATLLQPDEIVRSLWDQRDYATGVTHVRLDSTIPV